MKQNTRFRFVNCVWPILILLRMCWKKHRFFRFFEAVKDYNAFAEHLVNHHGSYQAAKFLKEAYNVGKRIALKCPVTYGDYPFWCRTAPGGVFPYRLRRLLPFLGASSFFSRRLALTVLSGFRLISHGVVGSYRSQLDPYDGDEIPSEDLTRAVRFLIRRFRLYRFSVRKKADPRSFWIGTSGVKGGRASLSSDYDAFCLLKPKFRGILDATLSLAERWIDRLTFRRWLGTVSMISLQKRLVRVREDVAKHIFISEGGSKTRGVTPVNGIIQAVLYPYHEFFMTLLRAIPTDCSFNESAGTEAVRAWTKEGLTLYSFDLSDATDRFPLEALRVVFTEFLGDSVCQNWLTLMRIPIRFGRKRKFLRPFSVGAPMGIYCLWPVFTLCHHAVMQMAAYDAGWRKFFALYRIRGDDVVIGDEAVALAYESRMLSFGIRFSVKKSFRGDVDGPGRGEFAKQLFLNGSVVTPFSLKAVRAARSYDPFSSVSVIADLFACLQTGRGPFTPQSGVSPDFVLSCFIRRGALRMIRTWLSFGWNKKIRDSLPDFLLPKPESWTLSQGASLALEISTDILSWELRSDLKKYALAFRERILTDNVDAFHRPYISGLIDEHPFFRAVALLDEELRVLRRDGRIFVAEPHARASRILHLYRSIRGLGAATLVSRRHVRYLMVSKYFRVLDEVSSGVYLER